VDACDGRRDTEGWTNIVLSVRFRSSDDARHLQDEAARALDRAGWPVQGSGEPGTHRWWTRPIIGRGPAVATLSPTTVRPGIAPDWVRVISASQPDWVPVFTGLSVRQFGKLVGIVRRRGGEQTGAGQGFPLTMPSACPTTS
jgi:hypothetical protein